MSWRAMVIAIIALCALFIAPTVSAQSVIIGTDGSTSNGTGSDPIDDYFNFMRYQVVYTAAELGAAGLPSGSSITALGFSVSEDNGPAFPSYSIGLGHTAATNSAAHDASPVTTVFGPASYDAVVTVAGAHNMITLTTPFVWNGTGNILVDICTGGSSMAFGSPYGGVRGSAPTNGSRRVRCDGCGTQCGVSTNTANAFKPQIRFDYTGGSACSGTPAPGNTTGPTTTLSGSPISLGLQNATMGSGVTYQWEQNINGGGWGNAPSTTSTYVPSPTQNTQYRCMVTCAGNGTTTSNVLSVTVVASQLVPFTGSNTVSCGTDVVLLDHAGTANYSNNANGYTVLDAGAAGIITISGTRDMEGCCDYLYIRSGAGTGGTAYLTLNGSGPVNYVGAPGETLTVHFTSDGSVTYPGFQLNVTYTGSCFSSACAGPPAPGNTTGPTTSLSGSQISLGLQNLTAGSGVTYQWEQNINGGGWGNAPSTNSTYLPSPTQNTQYRCMVTCAGNGTTTSNVLSVTVVQSVLVPFTGNNTVTCGTDVVLLDHAGTANYSDNANGYTVLDAGFAGVITISGTRDMEGCCDYLYIRSGAGTGGTAYLTLNGNGPVNYVGAPGETLTVHFTSDASVTYPGFQLNVTYSGSCASSPCAGTPAPGNTVSTVATACSGVNFTLSLQNSTPGSGVSYQWQRDTGSGMTNFGAGGTTQVISQTQATTYQCIVSCSGAVPPDGISTPVPVGLNANTCACGTYAAIYASSTFDEDITVVTVGSMTNNSACGALATGAGSLASQYSNYTGSVVGPSADQGASVAFSVGQGTLCGGTYGNIVQIYVDWNQDGVFNDTDERVFNQPGPGGPGVNVQTGNFTVPLMATLGTTRMRLVVIESAPTATNYAQTGYTWGETEDYCFTVTAASPCTGQPTPGNTIASVANACSGANFTLSLQNPTLGSGVTYQWESADDVNFTVNVAALGASNTQVTNQTSAKYYRCTCLLYTSPSPRD